MGLANYCLSVCFSMAMAQAGQGQAIPGDLLQDLGSKETKTLEAARKKVEALQPGPRVELLRLGMRLENRKAAAWCAMQLSWTELSNAEAPRFLELLWPILSQVHTEGAMEQFKSLLGSAELGLYLDALPPSGDRDLPGDLILSQLHRQVRPEHLPQLCKLFLGEDLEIANVALDLICMMMLYGDSHRDLIAQSLLARKADLDLRQAKNVHGLGALQQLVLPEKKDGYPPLLHACLEHFFDEGQITLRERPWKSQVEEWLWRWAQQVEPGPSDRELFLKLLSCKLIPGENIALRGLGQVGKPADIEAIRSYIRSSPGGRFPAWSSLARLGDEKALQQLQEKAADNAMAMGFLLEIAPKLARPLIEESLREDSAAKVGVILGLPRNNSAMRLGIQLSWEKDYAWLEGLLRRGRIPIQNRVALLVHVPPLHSQSLLYGLADPDLFRELRFKQVESLYAGDLTEFIGLLETSSPRQARRFLQGLAQHEEKEIQNFALDMLLKLGVPEMADQLIEHVRWASTDSGSQLILLGRTRTDKVRSWLAEQARLDPASRPTALRGLGIALGLPEALVWLSEDDVLDEKGMQHVMQELTKGRALEALLFWLERSTALFPERVPAEHLGLLKDPRITDYLLTLRKRRELGLYSWATGQLALQGHAEARLEQEAIYRIGRYRWIDESDSWSLLLDRNLSLLPFWIQQLETNSCRYTSVKNMFEELFGFDFGKSGFYNTPHRAASLWWKRAKGQLRYSHILDRYLITAKSHRKVKTRDR